MQTIRPKLLVTTAPPTEMSVEGDLPASESRKRLRDELVAQCDAMMHHAMGSGLEVPPDLLGRLDALLADVNPGSGIIVPPASDAGGSEPLNRLPGAELAAIHKTLASLVAPATPAAILLFARERAAHPVLFAIGPVPLIRHFLLLSAVSLIALLLVSLSARINVENLNRTLLNLSGLPLLMVEVFLLSAASLGSCFANLQKLNGYISTGDYDPKYQANYWGRWMMGVISGILLSQLFFPWLAHSTGEPGQPTSAGWLPSDLGQPTLALFGGYSASLVHRLIQRVMIAVESLFGSTK
jgi:hypothetical protein